MDLSRRLAAALAQKAAPDLPPPEAAKAAGLRYVRDDTPGITRRRLGDDFVYRDAAGAPIRDADTLARIKALAVPPAWVEVWICPDPRGHLQATGRDARGRKQYRYHPRWREQRDETKYEHMLDFGKALPRLRRRVEQDLSRPGLPREKVLAAVVRLMESTLARVGNVEYARDNGSFGLTTLQNRHMRIAKGRVELDFRAKHGIRHRSVIADRRLARILRNCRDLPGSELFQYLDEAGERRSIDSGDVNAYLRDISGAEITAKDFRTWAATNLAALALHELETFDTKTKAKKNVVQAVEAVSKMLGNTPAICRKCYIHPAIFDGYLDGSLPEALRRRAEERLDQHAPGLSAEEATITTFLSRRLAERIEQQGS
jgi:DNA topoisomerase I